MHDIDRTLGQEFPADFELDGTSFEGDFEADFEGEADFESEADFEGESEFDALLSGETNELTEENEIDLAAELLSVSSEQELDQFLGKLARGIGRGVKRFARSSVGRRIGGMLKGVAKRALPMVGGALGSLIAPGVGTAIGSKLGAAASNLFEVDLEGMDPEDAQFEVARRFVRLADTAMRQAARTPSARDPRAAARNALAIAARRHAPGLARALGAAAGGANGSLVQGRGAASGGGKMTGRWVRRGRTIVLLGV